MNSKLVTLTYEIELQAGEKLTLPDPLIHNIGPGQWRITIQPITSAQLPTSKNHDAFLSGYAPEDEGLYDDYPTR